MGESIAQAALDKAYAAEKRAHACECVLSYLAGYYGEQFAVMLDKCAEVESSGTAVAREYAAKARDRADPWEAVSD